MRGLSKFFAVAAVAAACAAPAAAAGFNAGGSPNGFNGSAPNSGESGPVLRPPGGGAWPHGSSGPSHSPGGVLLPPNPGAPNAGLKPPTPVDPNFDLRPPRHDAPPHVAGHGGHDRADWRSRARHYWLGGGPIFVPEPSGDYVYSEDDYDDGSDPSGCWVYRKAYDSAGAFLGFVHIDMCQGQ